MNTTRSDLRRVAALALAAAGALTMIPAAAAGAVEPEQSCWTDVDTDTTSCFDASLDPFAQIELATGAHLVAVPTGEATSAPRDGDDDDEVFLLATGWDATGQIGTSMSYVTSNPSICDGVGHGFASLFDWNNRFESLQSYNGCVTYLYDEIQLGGDEFGPITSSMDLGSFNNRAESMFIE